MSFTPGIEWGGPRGEAEGRATSEIPMKKAILPILALVFLLVGCEEDRAVGESRYGGGQREPVVLQEPTRIIVTSDDTSLPDGCHPRQVAELVLSFVDAFNSGDQASLS